MNFTIRNLFTAVFLAVLFMTLPETALAHKVSIFAWVEGDTVHTLSKFSGGRKVKNATVAVFDTRGNRLLDGRTDDQGEFSFKIPKKTALRLELIAGAGHKGHWVVPIEEINEAAEAVTGAATDNPSAIGGPPETTRFPGHDSTQIQAAIEKALDKKLKPVMKLLAESMQKDPSLSEIIGGIGYIIGLVGIAAYFKSRQKT